MDVKLTPFILEKDEMKALKSNSGGVNGLCRRGVDGGGVPQC